MNAEQWKAAYTGGRDVTYFRPVRWWHRFTRRHWRVIRVGGRPLTADDLYRLVGNPFEDDRR